MGPADKDPRWQIFGDLRDYLRKTFPTVHARADLQLVQGISMVFTLEGQDKSLKPMMLYVDGSKSSTVKMLTPPRQPGLRTKMSCPL